MLNHLKCVGANGDRSWLFVGLQELYELCGSKHIKQLLHKECVVGVVCGEVSQKY